MKSIKTKALPPWLKAIGNVALNSRKHAGEAREHEKIQRIMAICPDLDPELFKASLYDYCSLSKKVVSGVLDCGETCALSGDVFPWENPDYLKVQNIISYPQFLLITKV